MLRPSSCLLLAGFLFLCAPLVAEEHAELRLVASCKGREYTEFSVVDRQIVGRDGASQCTLPKETSWRLDGDLRRFSEHIFLAPDYHLVCRERLPRDGASSATTYATVVMWRGWPWKENDLVGCVAIVAWLVNGKPRRVEALPVFVRGEASLSISAVTAFELTPELDGGSPVLLVFKDGQFLTPKAVFGAREAGRVLREMYLGDDASLDSAVSDLRKPDIRSEHFGCMLLHLAAQGGRTHAVESLIARGAVPNVLDEEEATPLHRSATYGRTGAGAALIARGAKLNAVNAGGQRPLESAVGMGHLGAACDLVYDRIPTECILPAFRAAANRNDIELLERLLAHPDRRVVRKLEPREFANVIRAGDLERIERLIAAGMRTDGAELLLAACEGGNSAIVERLLGAGADVSGHTRDGVTALMIAAWNGHEPLVERLLAAGASVTAQTDRGATALSCAYEAGHDSIVELLRRHGAEGAGGVATPDASVNRLAEPKRDFHQSGSPVYSAEEVDERPVRVGPFAPEVRRIVTTAVSANAGPQNWGTLYAPRSQLSSAPRPTNWAVARLVVEPDGSTSSVQAVIAESAEFAVAVERALIGCRYRPGTRRNHAVRTRILEVVTVDE